MEINCPECNRVIVDKVLNKETLIEELHPKQGVDILRSPKYAPKLRCICGHSIFLIEGRGG